MERSRILTCEQWRALFWGVASSGDCWGHTEKWPRGLAVREKKERVWRWLAALVLLGELGLRVGEAVRVRWPLLGPVLKDGVALVLPGSVCKGGRPRPSVMTPAAVVVLERWQAVCGEVYGTGEAGHVLCVAGTGRPYTERGVQQLVRRLGARHLGMLITPHSLRRTFGDRVRKVADVRVAQLMLGHARLSSTERYLSDDWGERMLAARAISRDLFPTGPPGVNLGRWGPAEGEGAVGHEGNRDSRGK